MALKWPNKDPDEVLDYSVDWSRYLPSSVTITAVTWYMDVNGTKTEWTSGSVLNGLQHVSSTHTDSVCTIYLGNGDANTTYKITCAITTSDTLSTERVVQIKVRERY